MTTTKLCSEAAPWRSSAKKLFLKLLKNSQESTCIGVFFSFNFKKRLRHSCFPENFAKNTFYRTPLVVAIVCSKELNSASKKNQISFVVYPRMEMLRAFSKTPRWYIPTHRRRSCVFIVNFEHIVHLILGFLLLILNK